MYWMIPTSVTGGSTTRSSLGRRARVLTNERQEGRTQRSLSLGRFIVVLWFIVAMVNRLGQLDRLAGMELVLARLVALGFFGKESHSA